MGKVFLTTVLIISIALCQDTQTTTSTATNNWTYSNLNDNY